MVILFVAGIIALCAVLVLFRPDLINVLSENDLKKMNPKKTGRVAFLGAYDHRVDIGSPVALWHTQRACTNVCWHPRRHPHRHIDSAFNS